MSNNDRFKFRAWDERTKTCFDNAMIETLAPISTWVKNGWVVEQCTGLKDKNGRLIYEGDIIRLPWQAGWPDLIGVVKFNELYASFLLSKTITDRAEQSFWWNNSKEVIGNIHENPELLEDK